ncbi:MAG TPA: DNA strand exchange inhibitor protein [Gemmatales bacterium]|nr:DNA strand exchange inhibitor protein [Gemmatales bacterium]
MDTHSLELLDFSKIRELLAGCAQTALGKELARALTPRMDLALLQGEIELTSEMAELLAGGQHPPLGGLTDVRMLVRRAAIGSQLTAAELLAVKDVLACTGHVYRYRMRLGERCQRLSHFLTRVEDLGMTAKTIEGCLDDRGHLLDMASPELGRVRQKLRELDERSQTQLRRLLRDPEIRKILRFPHATLSGDHHVLPVAANYRHRLQGVVHRTSASGDTVYIEPAALAALAAERAMLRGEEEKEVARILRHLTAVVGRVARPLQIALDILARLDLLQGKARFSLDYGHAPPELNAEGRLWLRQARHPLLEHLFRHGLATDRSGPAASPTATEPAAPPRAVVPIDVRLGIEFDLLVITGPNTGGKTVALKTVGLLCVMAQCGMHIPAGAGSQVPLFERIAIDVGDEQSLEQSLSTFSSHISRIAEILRYANDRTLVLLDELGAGTDPAEGAALGRAILDELRQSGCRAMVTTHLGDLKTFAFQDERTENGAVEFDIETLRPTFRLHIGQFGMSNALQIARRLQLPRALIKRAKGYLHRRQRRAGAIKELAATRLAAEEARQKAHEAELAARQQQQELQEHARTLAASQAEAEALRRSRQALKAGDAVQVPKMREQGKVIRVDPLRSLAVVQVGLGQWELQLDEIVPVTASHPTGGTAR